MIAATRGFTPRSRRYRGVAHLVLLLGLYGLAHVSAQGQAPAPDRQGAAEDVTDGLFITVRNPLDSVAVNHIKAQTERFLDRPDHRGLRIVYDFNPDGHASNTGDYGVCRNLANFLLRDSRLQDVLTIAYVHGEVTGHTVLPVLACKEIVLSKQGKLGDALRDNFNDPTGSQGRPLEEDERLFYRTVAEGRGYAPALVLKMLDKEIEVLEGTRNGGTRYIDQRQEAKEKQEGFVRTRLLLPAGKRALYDAAQAAAFGLCKDNSLDTRRDVKEAYHLPTSSLREDPLQGREPNPWRIVLSGPVTQAMNETMQRRVPRAVHRGANLIILQLECGDGSTEAARSLADFLRDLKDDQQENPVKTVAYVTERARNTAVFIALGCTEIVMDRKAHLGGFERYLQDRPNYGPAISKSLEEVAERQGYPPLLFRGLCEPKLALHLVSRKGKPADKRLMDGDELDADVRDKQLWVDEGWVKQPGEWLNLDSQTAKKLDVAKFVYDGEPGQVLPWLRDRYGLPAKINEAGPDWLDDLAAFLCNPVVSVFLVMIGITGLILELKLPGVGFPGVVAAICFVLYFWAHSQLAGHLTMLAVLLFLLGLVLIGLEVFLVPGLGITGISGIVLVVVSLALVTLVRKPETTYEWVEFGTSLTTISFSLLAAVGVAFAIGYYLPHIPGANKLVLAPPAEHAELLEEETPATETNAALLGAIGEAATTLRPAGKARFGDDFVDVVAEGSYVQAGARVQVIEIEGNRIVVKEI
jgi:membrane-bound ClpP family serine protease